MSSAQPAIEAPETFQCAQGESQPYQAIVDAVAGPGWSVVPGLLSRAEVQSLAAEARALRADGGFRPAGVGRGEDLSLRPEVRGDQVAWVDPQTAGSEALHYLGRLEALREAINRDLFLGLFDFEGHFALYPPGSFYRRHLDQFRGVERRVLSCVLYLNVDWAPADGGQLRIYTDPANPGCYQEILPLGGTLVTFLSARFEHEVLPSRRERLSLTGWFRRRDSYSRA